MGRVRNKKVVGDSDVELRAELERLEREELRLLEERERYIVSHLWEYFNPFRWQERLLRKIRESLITIAPAPNKIGKTAMVAVILESWLSGYEAWNEVDQDYVGGVKVGGRYYRPSSLEIAPPVKVRLTGEDWNHHLGQVVVPELKKWFDMSRYTTKKNTQGVDYFWTHVNGSTLELLTHGMEDDLYESWFGHGWIPDEPPPEKKFTAMARGLFGNRGKILIPTTPLKEAWILDKLVLSNRRDVAVIDDLCCLDNEIFYDHDDRILTEMGLSGKRTRHHWEMEGQKKEFFDLVMNRDDKGMEAEQFLMRNIPETRHKDIMELYFLKFAKDTPLDEKPSRFFGTFKRLVGLVIKNFDPGRHIIPAFDIPTDWVVTPFIDLHLSKPHAISFFACDQHNRHYCIDEYWINCSPDEIADLIIRKKRGDTCWNIENVYIDPLSKGDNAYMKNRVEADDSFTIISEKLAEEGIYLQTASKDKESGFRNIRTWLEGVNRMPILYFLDSLQSVGSTVHNGVVYEIQRLCFDEMGRVEKVDDDFMENLYRYTLSGTEYVEDDRGGAFVLSGAGDTAGWLAS